MKLLSWLLALHLTAIALASYVAVTADCDGDRLRALFVSFAITGCITAVLTVVFLVRTVSKEHARVREIVRLVILLLIGLDESRMAANGWALLMELTS